MLMKKLLRDPRNMLRTKTCSLLDVLDAASLSAGTYSERIVTLRLPKCRCMSGARFLQVIWVACWEAFCYQPHYSTAVCMETYPLKQYVLGYLDTIFLLNVNTLDMLVC